MQCRDDSISCPTSSDFVLSLLCSPARLRPTVFSSHPGASLCACSIWFLGQHHTVMRLLDCNTSRHWLSLTHCMAKRNIIFFTCRLTFCSTTQASFPTDTLHSTLPLYQLLVGGRSRKQQRHQQKHTPCKIFHRCSALLKSTQVAEDATGIPHAFVPRKALEVHERKQRCVCVTLGAASTTHEMHPDVYICFFFLLRRVFRFLSDLKDWIAVRAHSSSSPSRCHVVLDLSHPSFFPIKENENSTFGRHGGCSDRG